MVRLALRGRRRPRILLPVDRVMCLALAERGPLLASVMPGFGASSSVG
jgi:hypothetical protein